MTRLYRPEEIIQVVLNFQPGWLAGLKSRFLLPDAVEAGKVTLLTTDKPVKTV